jgi:ethanolamine utilization protein EutL
VIGRPIKTNILSVRIISRVDEELRASLALPPSHISIGLITTDCDDVSYAALDEATKKAEVQVAYAKSMYAGSANASTRLAGEFFGILSGPSPAEVKSGIESFSNYISSACSFVSADEEGSVVYFAHTIARTGSYLSRVAHIDEGQPLAYLIAPPLEAMYAMDQALKSAAVELKTFYGPPTQTNFAGGLLTGLEADCTAACDAFARAVREVALRPIFMV